MRQALAQGVGVAHKASKQKQFSKQVEVKGKVIVDDPQEVLDCKVQTWTEIWRRHTDQWHQMQGDLEALVKEARSEEHQLGPIAAEQVHRAIKKYPENEGQGADQYTTELLYRLPPEAIEEMAHMLEDIERWVMWPASVLINLKIFFEKPAGGAGQ